MKTPKSGKGSPNYSPEKPKSSKYRGVSFQRSTSQWIASIGMGKKRFVQPCATELGAARAYDEMAIKWLREKARINFPIEGYEIPELPPVVGVDGLLTSEHVRDACHRYIIIRGLVDRDRMQNWTVVDNLFFPEDKKKSIEWMMEFCWKLGIDPMGYDL